MINNFGQTTRSVLLRTAATGAIATLALATPAQAIVPNDNFTPAEIIDETGANGVGMFFRNDGFVCSGTLINPRTVLFAAHCVNDRPESDYSDGNINSAFSFNDNALPGFINWINNGFSSNPDLFVYNISQIYYNPESLADPNAFGFLEADIALAALDDPARNIPTWALLFSPLPTPDSISDEDGTGYHVNITGYGRSGSGTTGSSQGIDWRRRAAENMLGSLSSFDDRNQFLFGDPFGDLPQVLYRLDFDDPNKTNPFDFNLYKDEPRVREATTAGGDSGGPLILDAANNSLTNENLQIGVLSGGSRFFGPQVFSSYGTESFYQPLFLFHDYIAAANPYRYVSAKAGDGAWEDATHWQTDLDPAYRIIDANGNVVNGFPDTQEAGRTGASPQFGEVCFDPEGDNPGDGCQDLATGDDTPPSRPAPTPAPTSSIGVAQVPNATPAEAAAATPAAPVVEASADVQATAVTASAGRPTIAANTAIRGEGMIVENVAISGGATIVDNIAISGGATPVAIAPVSEGGPEAAEEQPHAPGDPQPTPTVANGLAGATNFIPENIDSDTDGVLAGRRYFEVTLNQAGTTTLSSARTIDRLNVGGAAGLVINSNGSLTLENDGNQTGGRVAVDGLLTSAYDYTLFSGMLSGTGTVAAPFVTSIAGAIAPGSMGTIGTLTIDGNLILASGSTLLVDVGASGNSDLLAVTGEANLGGNVALAPVAGFQTATPSTYRILTADGGVTSQFNGVSNLSAILLSQLTYSANAVDLTVRAQSYQNVIDRNNPVQVSYAALMDRNRGNGPVSELFSFLDFTDAATIQATFNSWAPTTETTVRSMGKSTATNIANFFDSRIALSERDSSGGTIATIGRPMQTAAMALNGGVSGNAAVMTDFAAASAAQDVETVSNGVNEDIAVYLAGGYLDGEGRSMPLAGQPQGKDEFDGYFIAAGIEHFLTETSMIGFGFHYTDVDANAALGNIASSKTITGTLYGRTMIGQLALDTQVTAGVYEASTQRSLALGPQTFTLNSDDDNLLFTSSVDLSYKLGAGGFSIAPTVGMRATKIDFSNVIETGGPMALTTSRPDYDSLQGRAGVEFEGGGGSNVQFFGSAFYVHEFEDAQTNVAANFTNGVGLLAPFALAGLDDDWFEASAGVRVNTGNVSFSLSGFSTIERYDAEARGVSASATIRF